jgi:serine/threonine protein kinase/tetratricopeptide (TPR) repeat protein
MSDPSSGGPSESADGSGDPPESQDGNTLPMRGDTHAPEPRKTPAPWTANASSERPGDRVGSYTLLERIGSGGFGVVWRAERREPYVQQVAIKLLRPGMDSESVLARFEQERQSLAMMDHPNIAKVIDGGLTETGRNYFVMELVKGEPITRFCDRHRLPIERRLELFAQACDAMQHAHMKGIIHRDLKPGNILAAMGDTDGADGFNARVKIIDFGVAKATARPLTDRQLFTEMGQMIGTPEYMSPEQADGGLDVDTRTDIYALGVVLYELLVGATPFDPKSLRSAGLAAIHRIIRESDPPRPSERLRAMNSADSSPDTPSAITVAQERGTRSQTLLTRLRNELEWLPMKAMRKERSERYRSAAEFSDDIRNYLQGKPLIAGPESATYRTRKFVRRHRAAVAAGSLVALVVIAAAVVSTAFWLGEKRQRELAERREREVREVSQFQQDMLQSIELADVGEEIVAAVLKAAKQAGGSSADGSDTPNIDTVRQALQRANRSDIARAAVQIAVLNRSEAAATEQFKDSPQLEADLKHALAVIQFTIGDRIAAQRLEEAAERLRKEQAQNQESDPQAKASHAESLIWLGRIECAQEAVRKDQQSRARSRIREGLGIFENLGTSQILGTLDGHIFLAESFIQSSDFNQAIGILTDALERANQSLVDPSISTGTERRQQIERSAETLSQSLANALRGLGDVSGARQAVSEIEKRMKAGLGNAYVYSNVGLLYADLSRSTDLAPDKKTEYQLESLRLLRKAATTFAKSCGVNHPETALATANLLSQLWDFQRDAATEEILRHESLVLSPDWKSRTQVPVQCGIRLALAHARRSRGETTRSDQEAKRILDDALPNLAGDLAALQSIEEVAKYWEAGGRFDEASNVRRILLERHPKAANPCNATRNFVNYSTDLAYDLLWNKEPEEAMKSLTVALARAKRPIEDGGLDQCSEARWLAANLQLHILKGQASSMDAESEKDLAAARDEVNGLIRARTEANNSHQAGEDPLQILWSPKTAPRLEPGTPNSAAHDR